MPESFDGERARRNIGDFLIEDKIILELKARRIITKDDYFQVKRYLAATNKSLGVLVNFQQLYIRPKRILRGLDM